MADPVNTEVGLAEVGFFGFSAAAYSNEAPFLQNTGSGQIVLSDEYRDEIVAWIFDEKITASELRSRYPRQGAEFLATVNPDLFGPIIAAATSGGFFCDAPYITPNTDALCAAIVANSAKTFFDQINDYPFQWCHSPEDQTIPLGLTLLDLVSLGKPNVVPYVPALPFLQPFGGHELSGVMCHAAVPTFLQDNPDFLMTQNSTTTLATKGSKGSKGSKRKCRASKSKGRGKNGNGGGKSEKRRLRRIPQNTLIEY